MRKEDGIEGDRDRRREGGGEGGTEGGRGEGGREGGKGGALLLVVGGRCQARGQKCAPARSEGRDAPRRAYARWVQKAGLKKREGEGGKRHTGAEGEREREREG